MQVLENLPTSWTGFQLVDVFFACICMHREANLSPSKVTVTFIMSQSASWTTNDLIHTALTVNFSQNETVLSAEVYTASVKPIELSYCVLRDLSRCCHRIPVSSYKKNNSCSELDFFFVIKLVRHCFNLLIRPIFDKNVLENIFSISQCYIQLEQHLLWLTIY